MPDFLLTDEDKNAVRMGKLHVEVEKEKAFRPEQMLLLGEVDRLFRIYVKQNTRETRPSRRMILHHLERHDGCVQNELASTGHLSPPAISAEINQLEKEGLVTRKKDENDGRAFHIHLTEAGRKFNEDMIAEFRALNETVVSVLTESEKDEFFTALYKIREKLLSELS